MAQMTIYLDAVTQKAVESAAAREAMSLSRWARTHLQEAALRSQNRQPLSSFYGTIVDESFKEPSELSADQDNPRLALD